MAPAVYGVVLQYWFLYLCNFCPFLLRNSASSTVQTEPFPPSTRTKHLWRLRLCRTAFCRGGSRTNQELTKALQFCNSSLYGCFVTDRRVCVRQRFSGVDQCELVLWFESCSACGRRVTEEQSVRRSCGDSHLPCGRVVAEVGEHAREPVVDLVQSQLLLGRLHNRPPDHGGVGEGGSDVGVLVALQAGD